MYILERSKLAIVIPAYNEALTIDSVIKAVSVYGQPIVVDDCSSDQTAELSEKFGAVVVRHDVNQGYDGALNSGFEKAEQLGFSYVITFDADGQHDYSLISEYILKFNDGYELVLGVRPDFQRISERFFSLYTKFCFGIKDPLCGMKGYHMSLYKKQGYFDSFKSIGTELAIFSAAKGCKKIQLSIPIHPRKDSPRFGARFNANKKIIHALISTWRRHSKKGMHNEG